MKARAIARVGALASLAVLAVCAAATLPTDSIYQLRAAVTTQKGTAAGFDLYQGHPTVLGMFYGDCPAYCPMLITAVQVYEGQLDEAARARLRVLLVSFDAARDTPPRLTELANLHHADAARWTFAAAREPDARRIAELLGFHYRKLPDGSFDHTQMITLVDGEGRVLASTSKLIGDRAFAAKLEASTAAERREPRLHWLAARPLLDFFAGLEEISHASAPARSSLHDRDRHAEGAHGGGCLEQP